ncbi:MAG: hypothetical protein ACUVWZ_08010 [Anaerolineae bacterium]
MSTEYPDILGDLVEAQQRFEVNGVHYKIALDPEIVRPGEMTSLRIWLQNCWNVPVAVAITTDLPTHPSPTLWVIQKRTDVPLEAAEVGEVSIPIASAVEILPGPYRIPVTMAASCKTRGHYIRSQKTIDFLETTLLSFTTGLGLAASVGLGFVAQSAPRQELDLHVKGSSYPVHEADLTPTYTSHWTVTDLSVQGRAQQYVNEQRLFLLSKLVRPALYRAFFEESQRRFAQASLPLYTGEAVFLAKVLTYTVEYFFQRLEWQDAILVPAYTLAYRYNLALYDPVLIVTRADYPRMVRLAISLSFGLLRQRLGREPWTLEEQLAIADLVTERVTKGGILSAEFLYLPLLLGGLMLADQVQMPGEELAQSLEILRQARRKRSTDLAENPELMTLIDQLSQSTSLHLD